jgi:predicted MPP superfamily phosphohydrolase
MFGIERFTNQIQPSTQKQLVGGLSALIGVGAGLAGYSLFHEPLNIALETLTLTVPQAQGHLPPGGLRILHLSDTHFRGHAWREGTKIERIHRLVAGLEYDLLIHTGDFWHEEPGLQNLLALIEGLPKPRLGGYGVYGNHDHVCYSHSDLVAQNWANYQKRNGTTGNGHTPAMRERLREVYDFVYFFLNKPFVLSRTHFNNRVLLRRALAEKGIEILNNRSVHLVQDAGPLAGLDLYLAGVDDVTEGWCDVGQALAGVPADKPILLLSHNPDILQEPEVTRADVILAGHTHGGQIVLPWVGAVHTHSDQLARREVSGYLRRGKTQIYITRGVGEGIPFRFGAPPQIALITLKGA